MIKFYWIMGSVGAGLLTWTWMLPYGQVLVALAILGLLKEIADK